MPEVNESPVAGMSPPTRTEPPDPAVSRGTWPTVVGVISIVLGSLGTLIYGCGSLSNVMMGVFSRTIASSGGLDPVTQAQMDVAQQYGVWNALSALGLMALAILLLVCGIGVVRRRAWSAKFLRVWAVFRMIYAIFVGVLGYVVSVAQFEAMEKAAQESGTAMPSGFLAILQGVGPVMAGFGLLIAWSFPVFVLIWFTRSKVKADVADWSEAQRRSI